MTVSDLLTFIGILVSVFFGYLVAHYHSVRDARIRTIKDHYIEQVKAIKGHVDSFFHKIAFGKSSCKKVVKWYDHISIDIKSVDEGVRKSLDLQIDKFGDILDRYYGDITCWDDFNDQYAKQKFHPNSESRSKLLEAKNEIDNFLNDYIDHINQANNYPIWISQKRRIYKSKEYYSRCGKICPLYRAIWERVEKHFWELLITIIAVLSLLILVVKVEPINSKDTEKPLFEISAKQDSIFHAIKSFEEKYQPVEIQTKTFNNSSFFNANNIDSVQVILYQKR